MFSQVTHFVDEYEQISWQESPEIMFVRFLVPARALNSVLSVVGAISSPHSIKRMTFMPLAAPSYVLSKYLLYPRLNAFERLQMILVTIPGMKFPLEY